MRYFNKTIIKKNKHQFFHIKLILVGLFEWIGYVYKSKTQKKQFLLPKFYAKKCNNIEKLKKQIKFKFKKNNSTNLNKILTIMVGLKIRK